MHQSFRAFVSAVFQKWWLLVTGIVGGGVFLLNLLGINPSTSIIVGGVILVACLLFACYMAYHDLYQVAEKDHAALLQMPKATLTMPKGKRLSSSHHIALYEVETLMETVHGHSDHDGLEADVRDGVLVSDLMARNCTRCGLPRNQRGDFS